MIYRDYYTVVNNETGLHLTNIDETQEKKIHYPENRHNIYKMFLKSKAMLHILLKVTSYL